MDDYGKVSFDIQTPGSVGFDVHPPGSTNFDLGNARSTGSASDYNKLKNKPAINDHELVGNQTASELGLATPDDINIFMARYGVTKQNELSAALNEKKYIYAVSNGIPSQLYELSDVKFGSEAVAGEDYVFTFSRFDGTVLKRIACRYGVWQTLDDIDLAETGGQTFWFGTRAEYNALPQIDPETVYCIEEGT